MKKLILTSIAALLLATGTAHATDYPPSLKAGAWVSMCTSKEAAAKNDGPGRPEGTDAPALSLRWQSLSLRLPPISIIGMLEG